MKHRPMGMLMALEKKYKNPLTNRPSCDTIRVSRGEVKQPRSHQERKSGDEVGTLKKNVKNPLTNRPSYDIIGVQR